MIVIRNLGTVNKTVNKLVIIQPHGTKKSPEDGLISITYIL
jgi:hypothetical protein